MARKQGTELLNGIYSLSVLAAAVKLKVNPHP